MKHNHSPLEYPSHQILLTLPSRLSFDVVADKSTEGRLMLCTDVKAQTCIPNHFHNGRVLNGLNRAVAFPGYPRTH
jgi:hypothetical protein